MVEIDVRPLAPALAAHAVAALTMALIPPKDTGARFAAVIAIAALCLHAIGATDRSTDGWQCYAEYMFGFILHANCFLVLLQLGAPKTEKTTWQRLRWSTTALFTPRRTLPKTATSMKTAPNPWIFALSRLALSITLAAAYNYLQHDYSFPFAVNDPVLSHADVAPDKVSLLLQLYHGILTRRALQIRAQMSFLAITMPALLLSSTHALFSALAVTLCAAHPADWPPLFGSIFDAYSVRRWYSHFWDKLMRKALTINAAWVTSRVLGLRPGSATGRCCIVMLSFTMSGFMHTMSSWQPGPCASWMTMWTYVATGAVILLERGVQAVYARLVHGRKGLGWRWKTWEIWAWRLVGYCWVVFWWLEVLPWAIMPHMRCHWLEEDKEW